MENYLKQHHIPVFRVTYGGKKDILKAIFSIYKIIRNTKNTIVHTHLFDANIAGLMAAKLAGVKKRIYTRHHSTYHHQYFPNAVKYDRFCNYLATDIIAISENVRNVLHSKENVPSSKIHLIHHGFQLKSFATVPKEKVELLRRKYNISDNPKQSPVIGVISRYIELKGLQYIIPAFEKILVEYPNALLLLANTDGDYKKEIKEMLKNIPPNNYLKIKFEKDIFSLYKLFDIFIHVPINLEIEAFGQTYVEPLASGIPSIFTLSGVANEFIRDNYNALVVPYKNSEAIYHSILELTKNDELRNQLIQNGYSSTEAIFSLNLSISQLETLYAEE